MAFPLDELGGEVLREILRGGGDAAPRPASRSSAGTRSTTPSRSTAWRSPGTSHPDAVSTNAGGRAGDALVLTKPVGVGRGRRPRSSAASPTPLLAAAVEVMTTLNRDAAAEPPAAGAHAR